MADRDAEPPLRRFALRVDPAAALDSRGATPRAHLAPDALEDHRDHAVLRGAAFGRVRREPEPPLGVDCLVDGRAGDLAVRVQPDDRLGRPARGQLRLQHRLPRLHDRRHPAIPFRRPARDVQYDLRVALRLPAAWRALVHGVFADRDPRAGVLHVRVCRRAGGNAFRRGGNRFSPSTTASSRSPPWATGTSCPPRQPRGCSPPPRPSPVSSISRCWSPGWSGFTYPSRPETIPEGFDSSGRFR